MKSKVSKAQKALQVTAKTCLWDVRYQLAKIAAKNQKKSKKQK